MIDRRTVLICVTLVALMLAAVVWRTTMPGDWTVLVVQDRAAVPFWVLFFFPAAGTFCIGALYWRNPRADVAGVERWRTWGAFVSIGYCALLPLLQAVLIVMSLNLGMHFYLWAIYRTLGVLLGIMMLVAVNQMPKLPYFERRFLPGGDLGPIYGPRYVRLKSRIIIVWMVGVIAFIIAATPGMGWRPALFIVLVAAFLVVWLIAWRRYLGRKWQLEQLGARGR